jgi:hypothetical protein
MNIVTNNFMLKYFKNISIFKLDIGDNLKGSPNNRDQEKSIRILDGFIKKYKNLNGTFIRKYGEIGSLKFYEDGSIERNIFHIYDDEKIYEIVASTSDLQKDPKYYLTEILQMLEDGVEDEHSDNISCTENDMIKDVTYSNMPENVDRPDMKLPKDQYIEALLRRRRFLDKI